MFADDVSPWVDAANTTLLPGIVGIQPYADGQAGEVRGAGRECTLTDVLCSLHPQLLVSPPTARLTASAYSARVYIYIYIHYIFLAGFWYRTPPFLLARLGDSASVFPLGTLIAGGGVPFPSSFLFRAFCACVASWSDWPAHAPTTHAAMLLQARVHGDNAVGVHRSWQTRAFVFSSVTVLTRAHPLCEPSCCRAPFFSSFFGLAHQNNNNE